MWCSTCRTDVSVRTTGHAGGLLCAQCGHDLLAASKPTDAIRQAREILERWNSSDLFERISRTESLDSLQTRSDGNKNLAKRTSLLTRASKSNPPENIVAEAGPSIPLTILKDPLKPQDLASISPKHYRESEDVSIHPRDEQTAEIATAQFVAPEERIDSANAHEISNTIHDEVEDPVQFNDDSSVNTSAGLDVRRAGDVNPLISCEESEKQGTYLPCSPVKVITSTSLDHASDEPRKSDQPESSDTGAPVTTHGITSELQRVYELALAEEAKLQSESPSGMALAADLGLPEHSNDFRDADNALAASAGLLSNTDDQPTTSDLSQIPQPEYPAIMDIREESALSPTKPAESANVNELHFGAVPTKMTRSPMRRPLLHRRFQMERPATTSSTGSENVNRKLRVDQPGGTSDAPETAQQAADFIASSVAPETKIVSNAPKAGRRFRIDGAESVDTVTGTDGRRARTQTLPKHRYIDDAHESSMRGPHFEITTPRRSNLTSATGQFLAYLGVLGLTVGTAMVIYGHFGGYSEYTPTGWLVTTVAQMLLFLGVINLVSGGIEQNNEDVSRRINTLGEQLIRIEQVTTDVLRGPKLSPRLYDDPNAEAEESSRETANVQRD